jgi:hypothetical protein
MKYTTTITVVRTTLHGVVISGNTTFIYWPEKPICGAGHTDDRQKIVVMVEEFI